MKTHFIEAVSDAGNWGKFMVGAFDETEWRRHTAVDGYEQRSLLHGRGWTRDHVLVLDLATGEGALMRAGGHAVADLNNHKVWVCPLFEPFLEWLWRERALAYTTEEFLDRLPTIVEFTGIPLQLSGYRRSGPLGGVQ